MADMVTPEDQAVAEAGKAILLSDTKKLSGLTAALEQRLPLVDPAVDLEWQVECRIRDIPERASVGWIRVDMVEGVLDEKFRAVLLSMLEEQVRILKAAVRECVDRDFPK